MSDMYKEGLNRNIELMWLTSELNPTYKTIANFRKENPKALKQVFKEFVLLCKGVGLIGGQLVGVNGSMSKRALKMIFEWLDLHKDELLEDWQLAQDRKTLLKIAPLA